VTVTNQENDGHSADPSRQPISAIRIRYLAYWRAEGGDVYSFLRILPIVCWRMAGAPEKVSVRPAEIDPRFDIV